MSTPDAITWSVLIALGVIVLIVIAAKGVELMLGSHERQDEGREE